MYKVVGLDGVTRTMEEEQSKWRDIVVDLVKVYDQMEEDPDPMVQSLRRSIWDTIDYLSGNTDNDDLIPEHK